MQTSSGTRAYGATSQIGELTGSTWDPCLPERALKGFNAGGLFFSSMQLGCSRCRSSPADPV